MSGLKKFQLQIPSIPNRRQLGAGGTKDNANSRGNAEQGAQEILREYAAKPGRLRCMVLFDATGSMGAYWNEIGKRISEIVARLLNAGFDSSLKIVAYRDDCDGGKIIEPSPWSNKADELQRFIRGIRCSGGGDEPEAVDRALQIAVAEQDVSGIILIGDAPPHQNRPGIVEAQSLGKARRPVYPIVVGGAANTRRAFEQIAQHSGGRMVEIERLDELYDVLGVVMARTMGPKAFEEYLHRYRGQLTESARKAAGLLGDGKR